MKRDGYRGEIIDPDILLDEAGATVFARGIDLINQASILRNEATLAAGTVQGTRTYEVEFYDDEDGVNHIGCSCPHFAKGSFCKHLVAFGLRLAILRDGAEACTKMMDICEDIGVPFDMRPLTGLLAEANRRNGKAGRTPTSSPVESAIKNETEEAGDAVTYDPVERLCEMLSLVLTDGPRSFSTGRKPIDLAGAPSVKMLADDPAAPAAPAVAPEALGAFGVDVDTAAMGEEDLDRLGEISFDDDAAAEAFVAPAQPGDPVSEHLRSLEAGPLIALLEQARREIPALGAWLTHRAAATAASDADIKALLARDFKRFQAIADVILRYEPWSMSTDAFIAATQLADKLVEQIPIIDNYQEHGRGPAALAHTRQLLELVAKATLVQHQASWYAKSTATVYPAVLLLLSETHLELCRTNQLTDEDREELADWLIDVLVTRGLFTFRLGEYLPLLTENGEERLAKAISTLASFDPVRLEYDLASGDELAGALVHLIDGDVTGALLYLIPVRPDAAVRLAETWVKWRGNRQFLRHSFLQPEEIAAVAAAFAAGGRLAQAKTFLARYAESRPRFEYFVMARAFDPDWAEEILAQLASWTAKFLDTDDVNELIEAYVIDHRVSDLMNLLDTLHEREIAVDPEILIGAVRRLLAESRDPAERLVAEGMLLTGALRYATGKKATAVMYEAVVELLTAATQLGIDHAEILEVMRRAVPNRRKLFKMITEAGLQRL